MIRTNWFLISPGLILGCFVFVAACSSESSNPEQVSRWIAQEPVPTAVQGAAHHGFEPSLSLSEGLLHAISIKVENVLRASLAKQGAACPLGEFDCEDPDTVFDSDEVFSSLGETAVGSGTASPLGSTASTGGSLGSSGSSGGSLGSSGSSETLGSSAPTGGSVGTSGGVAGIRCRSRGTVTAISAEELLNGGFNPLAQGVDCAAPGSRPTLRWPSVGNSGGGYTLVTYNFALSSLASEEDADANVWTTQTLATSVVYGGPVLVGGGIFSFLLGIVADYSAEYQDGPSNLADVGVLIAIIR